MASIREIKERIANVGSTEQIIRAMDMIASTKLNQARTQLEGVRPIYDGLKRQVEEVGSLKKAASHVFYEGREVKNSLYVVLTSDRGFAGSYNANILTKALKHMNEGKNEKILVVGSIGDSFFRKRKKNIIRRITDVSDSQVYYGTLSLAKWMTDLYLSGEVDEIFIAYTDFENVMTHHPMVEQLLPIDVPGEGTTEDSDRIYEQGIDTFIDHIIPLYLHMNLFRAYSESHTSEQAARMVNMDAAGKNAEEIIDDLNLQYNRQRQADITQELSEIIGGSNF
ncbi:ATP synthase F1 subunit gamma [Jeotgalibaca porci]|uniref:ATP synthase F1 subunit gamma n=1 Tax=Jeotgalibaca porci TaxID=1868793 RepID=UPI0035A05F57